MVTEIRRVPTPDLAAKYKGHKKDIPRFAGQALNQVVLSSGVLGLESIDFRVAKHVRWSVDDQLAAHVDALCDFHRGQSAQGARVYKGVMGRVVELRPRSLANMRISFQPSAYFNHVATNLSMECIPAGWTDTIRTRYEPGPRLSDFAASLCSNHLGLDALLVTGDGKLVIPQRTMQVAVNRGMYSASASGAFEFEAMSGESHVRQKARSTSSTELVHTPFDGIYKELEEELAVSEDEIKLLVCTGLSRDLVWGGKPQMYFYCESPLSAKEIEARIERGAGRDATFENQRREYHPFTGLRRKQQEGLLKEIASDSNSAPPLRAAAYFLYSNLDALAVAGAGMLA